MIITAL